MLLKLSKPKLLLVDDDERILHIYSQVLKKYFDVHTSQNVDEAKIMMLENKYKIGIFDMFFPGRPEGGIELLEYIRREKLKMKCIILTGNATIKTASYAVDSIAIAYYEKGKTDTNYQVLLKAIEASGLKYKNIRRIASIVKNNQIKMTLILLPFIVTAIFLITKKGYKINKVTIGLPPQMEISSENSDDIIQRNISNKDKNNDKNEIFHATIGIINDAADGKTMKDGKPYIAENFTCAINIAGDWGIENKKIWENLKGKELEITVGRSKTIVKITDIYNRPEESYNLLLISHIAAEKLKLPKKRIKVQASIKLINKTH